MSFGGMLPQILHLLRSILVHFESTLIITNVVKTRGGRLPSPSPPGSYASALVLITLISNDSDDLLVKHRHKAKFSISLST